MEIRNSLDGLKSLLGIDSVDSAATRSSRAAAKAGDSFDADRVTMSAAANEVSQVLTGEGVRTEKVAAVRSALEAGTYSVPASALAAKLVETMLASGQQA